MPRFKNTVQFNNNITEPKYIQSNPHSPKPAQAGSLEKKKRLAGNSNLPLPQ
jgi:hypothetical protein